jgi:hypothetical protein
MLGTEDGDEFDAVCMREDVDRAQPGGIHAGLIGD